MNRCKWCNLKNQKYIYYHDNIWGKLNTSDEYLYKASFQNIAKLVTYFDVTYSLFKE